MLKAFDTVSSFLMNAWLFYKQNWVKVSLFEFLKQYEFYQLSYSFKQLLIPRTSNKGKVISRTPISLKIQSWQRLRVALFYNHLLSKCCRLLFLYHSLQNITLLRIKFNQKFWFPVTYFKKKDIATNPFSTVHCSAWICIHLFLIEDFTRIFFKSYIFASREEAVKNIWAITEKNKQKNP